MSTMIRTAGLTRVFHQGDEAIVAVDRVSVAVEAGEFVILAGASGSGKTTLLTLLGGLDRPTSGSLEVADLDLIRAGESALTRFRRERVGFVFQDFRLVRHLTAMTNVAFPQVFSASPSSSERPRRLLERFRLGDRLHHLPRSLSRGEMQRVALARALVNRPHLLLADEPTGNLDRANGEIIWNHFQDLHRSGGLTIVVATHDRTWQERAGRVITIEDGRIVADENIVPRQ